MNLSPIYKAFIFLSIAVLFSSCLATKDYTRPENNEIAVDSLYRTSNIAQDSTSMAKVSWRSLFTDPILQKHIDTALTNNTDIRIALEQINSAQSYFKQASKGQLPTANANAQYNHQELSGSGQFGRLFSSIDQFEISANLQWEADIWGKIRSNKRAFNANYLQTVAAHQAVTSTLVAQVSSLYFQLLSLDEQIKITKETIETRRKSLETTMALKEAGNLTEVAVKQTEAQLYTAQVILIDLNMFMRTLENTFSILLGKTPQEIERSTFNAQVISTPLQTGIPVELLSNRPDVISAQYALIEAFELTNVANAQFYPQLTLTGSVGLQSLEIQTLFDPKSIFANFLAGLTQPIFNGRKIRTDYEVAESNQKQAVLRFRESILNASKEVADAMYTYEANTKRIEIIEKEYEAYRLAFNYSQVLLDNGYADYLEVLSAQSNELSSQLRLVDAKLNQLNSVVDLYKAVGGGWQ